MIIDVFVELEDGSKYTFTVSTPNNYFSYMKKEKINYILAAPPDIIVKELKEDFIRSAIESFSEDDAYFLKQYANM